MTSTSTVAEKALFVRGFTIADVDRDDAFAGLQDPHHMIPSDLPAWRSLLRGNPDATSGDLALVLAIDGNQVVGRLGCFAGTVRVPGQQLRGMFLSGFEVEPGYRRTGAGGLVLMRVLSAARTIFTAGAPDENAQQLYHRLKFAELGPLRRFMLPMRARPIIEYLTHKPWLGRLAGPPADSVLVLYRSFAARRTSSRLVLERVERLPDAIDALSADDPRNLFPKTARMYDWILAHAPNNQAYIVKIDAELAGYLVLGRYRHPGGGDHRLPPTDVASLKDYYLAPKHAWAIGALLGAALTRLGSADADLIECQVAEPAMAAACKAAGLVEKGGNRVYVRGRFAPGDLDRPWFITYAVGDQIFG